MPDWPLCFCLCHIQFVTYSLAEKNKLILCNIKEIWLSIVQSSFVYNKSFSYTNFSLITEFII